MLYYFCILLIGIAFFFQMWVAENLNIKILVFSLFLYPIIFLVIFVYFPEINVQSKDLKLPILLFFSSSLLLNLQAWLKRSN